MAAMRLRHQGETPQLFAQLSGIANRLWETAQSAQTEAVRGNEIAVKSISLRVFINEELRARIRRAMEGIFQVQFSDAALTYDITRVSAGFRVAISEPFECVFIMRRTTEHGPNPPQRPSASEFLAYGQRVPEPLILYEWFQLETYDRDAWCAYLEEAEANLAYTNARDLLRRCPDRDAVLDVISVFLLTEDRPRLVYDPDAAEQRKPRGVRIRERG